MAKGFNKVILMGNLTRDPELRYTQSNTAVTKLGLAINRRWRNQNGEQQEETCFVDCTAFGRTGERPEHEHGQGDEPARADESGVTYVPPKPG